MSYIKNGREFDGEGLGATTDDLTDLVDSGSAAASTLSASAQAALIEAKLAIKKQQAAASKAIDKLKDVSSVGPILAEALRGSTSPQAVADRAKTLAASLSTNATAYGTDVAAAITALGKNKAEDLFRLGYSQLRSRFDAVEDYLTTQPTLKAMVGTVRSTDEWITKVEKYSNTKLNKGTIDASGVADGLGLAAEGLKLAKQIAVRFGAGSKEANAIQQVIDWVGIGATCVTAVAAGAAVGGWGAIGGAVACGIAVLAKALSYGGSTKVIEQPAFFSPGAATQNASGAYDPGQWAMIAADAQRLAMVLRTHYGIASYKQLLATLEVNSGYFRNTVSRTPLEMVSASTTYVELSTAKQLVAPNIYPAKSDSSSYLPAWTGTALVLALGHTGAKTSKDIYGAGSYSDQNEITSKSYPALNYARTLSNLGLWAISTYEGSVSDGALANVVARVFTGDLPPEAIEQGAALARKLGSALLTASGYYKATSMTVWKAGIAELSRETVNVGYYPLEACMKASELLNFFAAITLSEVETAWEDIYNFLQSGSPVRLYSGDGMGRGTDPTLSSVHGGSDYWQTIGAWQGKTVKDLATPLKGYGVDAARQVAYIRILAALSYMHMIYHWGWRDKADKDPSGRVDPIAKLPSATTSKAGWLRDPVNPRSTVVNNVWVSPSATALWSQAKAREKTVKTILLAASQAAAADRNIITVLLKQKLPAELANALVTKNPRVAAGIVTAAGYAKKFAKDCRAASSKTKAGTSFVGVPGATKLDKLVCCPSLYYNGNLAMCDDGKGGMTICQGACTSKDSYISATVQRELTDAALASGRINVLSSGKYTITKAAAKDVTISTTAPVITTAGMVRGLTAAGLTKTALTGFGATETAAEAAAAAAAATKAAAEAAAATVTELGKGYYGSVATAPMATLRLRTIAEYEKATRSRHTDSKTAVDTAKKAIAAADAATVGKTVVVVAGVAVGALLLSKLLKG